MKHHLTKELCNRRIKRKLFKVILVLGLITATTLILIGAGKTIWTMKKEFIREMYNTHQLINHCKEMKEFTRNYPKSVMNKTDISNCEVLGLI